MTDKTIKVHDGGNCIEDGKYKYQDGDLDKLVIYGGSAYLLELMERLENESDEMMHLDMHSMELLGADKGKKKNSYEAKIDPKKPPSDRALMLLKRWDKTCLKKLIEIEKEFANECRWLSNKHDPTGKLPYNGWGRTALNRAATEANGYYDYQFQWVQVEQAMDNIKARIKALDYVLGWWDEEEVDHGKR